MAVLGLVIEEPAQASWVAQRLSERFRLARFAPSTAHTTLLRLDAQGYVRRLPPPHDREATHGCYEATEAGIDKFRRWLRTVPGTLPALREPLHARIDLCEPGDLDRVMEITYRERRDCEREYAAARGRLAQAHQTARFKGDDFEWSALVREVVMVDEAMILAYRAARLERLHARLQDLHGRLTNHMDEQGRSAPPDGGSSNADQMVPSNGHRTVASNGHGSNGHASGFGEHRKSR